MHNDPFESEESARSSDGAFTDAAVLAGEARTQLEWVASVPHAESVFAALVFWDLVRQALRAEGYAFTEDRFADWIAGAARLDFDAPPGVRSASGIAVALDSELRWLMPNLDRSTISPIMQFQRGGETGQRPAALQTAEFLAEARDLVASAEIVVTRFMDRAEVVRSIEAKANRSVSFTQRDNLGRSLRRVDDSLVVEPMGDAPATWAIDVFMGRVLVGRPLPCPGFGRVLLGRLLDGETEAERMARAMSEGYRSIIGSARQARMICEFSESIASQISKGSRLPEIIRLIGQVGAMRSKQIEDATGISRFGVRAIMAKASAMRLIKARTVSGIVLYALKAPSPAPANGGWSSRSNDTQRALTQMELASAELDRLNARFGLTSIAGEEDD